MLCRAHCDGCTAVCLCLALVCTTHCSPAPAPNRHASQSCGRPIAIVPHARARVQRHASVHRLSEFSLNVSAILTELTNNVGACHRSEQSTGAPAKPAAPAPVASEQALWPVRWARRRVSMHVRAHSRMRRGMCCLARAPAWACVALYAEAARRVQQLATGKLEQCVPENPARLCACARPLINTRGHVVCARVCGWVGSSFRRFPLPCFARRQNHQRGHQAEQG